MHIGCNNDNADGAFLQSQLQIWFISVLARKMACSIIPNGNRNSGLGDDDASDVDNGHMIAMGILTDATHQFVLSCLLGMARLG